jgi:SAM-dependent methyltransferase
MNIKNKVHKCTFCDKNVQYNSIEQELGKILKENDFPYGLDDFETLSFKTYACSSCGASDRDRLYKLYIDKYGLPGGAKSNLLDFAPSSQLSSYLKTKTKKYRSADLFMEGVDDKVDITDMKQYKDNMFDFFVCSHILEHVESDIRALYELYRVLKPGGKGILMTPIIDRENIHDEDPSVVDTKERLRRFAQDDHVRLYEKKVFLERVENAGFSIGTFEYRKLGLISMLRNGINLKSRLYIVGKEAE